METHVLTFTITKSFAEWVATYDASLSLQKIAGITSLYRGVSKDDPSKVCGDASRSRGDGAIHRRQHRHDRGFGARD